MADIWVNWLAPFLIIIAQILAVALPVAISVAFLVYFERKVFAAMTLRRGPNVVGPWGVLQSFADFIKIFFKETIVPSGANKAVFLAAPVLTFILAFIAWAVVPFAPGWVIADINVGILYLFAVSSLGVYGMVMAGWASNSRYPFLGALRSAAQMVSYEVSMGFVIVTVLLVIGSLNLSDIVLAQKGLWFAIPLFPMFIIFFISALAETNRHPFDLPEAESELVAGYQVEYSAIAFVLFFLGEYANMILMSAMTAILFLGWLVAAIRYRAVHVDPRTDLVHFEDRLPPVCVHLGAGNIPALPLRSAYAPGLEGVSPVLTSLGRSHRRRAGVLRSIAAGVGHGVS